MAQFRGLVQVYTGDGKGKTTAAFGLALRALGQGLKVCIIQFLKSSERYQTGENKIARTLPNLEIFQFGGDYACPDERIKDDPKVKLELKKALNLVSEVIREDKYDLLILDEINVALAYGLLDLRDVLNLIEAKPPRLELVLTGRWAPQKLIEVANLVTEMKEVKHPHQRGIKARKGIEY